MHTSPFRAAHVLIFVLAMLSLPWPSFAQQDTGPDRQQVSPLPQPPAVPAQPAAASDLTTTRADGGSRPLKSAATALRELSPWSMFLSADILVKAVMIGLAF